MVKTISDPFTPPNHNSHGHGHRAYQVYDLSLGTTSTVVHAFDHISNLLNHPLHTLYLIINLVDHVTPRISSTFFGSSLYGMDQAL